MLALLGRERVFALLLGGGLLSRIGDGIHEFVFIITVLKVTGNGVAAAGVIYFFRFIPYLALGPLGGALADRLPRKPLMVGADLARMLITGLICGLLITDCIGAVSLTLLSMMMTGLRTIFQPAFQAAIPLLVQEADLPGANGAVQLIGETGGLLGPAVGGAALAVLHGPGQVLTLDAVSYLVSALSIAAVRIPSHRAAVGHAALDLGIPQLCRDVAGNIGMVRKNSSLFITIFYSSACILLVGAALRILIPTMMVTAGFSEGQVGYAMSVVALGAIAGVLSCDRMIRTFSARRLMIYWGLYGLVLALLPACVPHAAGVFAGCFILGAAGALVDVALPTNIQKLSTGTNMGRNFGLFSTLANTGEALSGGFAGVLVLMSSVGVAVTTIGLLIASVAYVGKAQLGGGNE